MPGHHYLKRLPLAVFLFLVCLLPAFFAPAFLTGAAGTAGVGIPWFCKYVCPSGTLFGAVPLMAASRSLREAAGVLFCWKALLLFGILLWSVVYYRPFCKYLCPLGAVYGLFHPISVYRFRIDETKCIGCHACERACRMEIPVWKQPNSPECIRCGDCKKVCPTGAILTAGIQKRTGTGKQKK